MPESSATTFCEVAGPTLVWTFIRTSRTCRCASSQAVENGILRIGQVMKSTQYRGNPMATFQSPWKRSSTRRTAFGRDLRTLLKTGNLKNSEVYRSGILPRTALLQASAVEGTFSIRVRIPRMPSAGVDSEWAAVSTGTACQPSENRASASQCCRENPMQGNS